MTGSRAFARLDSRRRLHRCRRGRAAAGRRRRAGDRRQHGRGDARFEGGDGPLPESHRRRARHRARARDDRLVEVGGDRGRPQVRPGQAGRQLDLAQGRRGRVPASGAPRPPLRRGGDRDGVRRDGTGRHLSAQGRDLPARLRDSDDKRRTSRPRTSSSIPTSSRSRPASTSTRTTRSTTSTRPAGSASTCPTRRCRAACRT